MISRPFSCIVREGQDKVRIGRIETFGRVIPGFKTRTYMKQCKCGKRYEASSRNHYTCPLCFEDWEYKKENENEK